MLKPMLKQCIISSMEIDDRWGEKYRFYLAFFFTIYIFLTTPQALSQALADHAMLSVFLWFIHAVFCQLHNLSRRLPHDAYHSTHTKKLKEHPLTQRQSRRTLLIQYLFFPPLSTPRLSGVMPAQPVTTNTLNRTRLTSDTRLRLAPTSRFC